MTTQEKVSYEIKITDPAKMINDSGLCGSGYSKAVAKDIAKRYREKNLVVKVYEVNEKGEKVLVGNI